MNLKIFFPVQKILNRFCDKWSIVVLIAIKKSEVARFNELYRNIPKISQKMLTATLRKLEADKLIVRTVYPEVPPRVEYELTEVGRSLLPHIRGLYDWAIENEVG